MSRRSLFQGAAAAGAVGLAATALGSRPAAAAAVRSAAAGSAAGGAAQTAMAPGADPALAPAGPLVVHVRDAGSGDIEVFSGASQTRLRDTDLAARLAGLVR